MDNEPGHLFRSMEKQEDHPRVGTDARSLGVRPGPDIEVDDLGIVRPGAGGMSVSPENVVNLPTHRRPPSWGGTGKDPVWRITEDELGQHLAYRSDPLDPKHGFVEPAGTMQFNDYQEAIHATRELWEEIDPEDYE